MTEAIPANDGPLVQPEPLARLPLRPAQRPWVPIRALGAHHRDRIVAHLQGLSERDRYLRFGYAATDEHVQRYVDGLKFERDEVFGIFNRRLALVALAHLAYPDAGFAGVSSAEFGGSVCEALRGRGFGARLFEHAMLHARNRGIDTLFIHALSENTTMLRIARQAGGVVHRTGSETDAYVQLPRETLASRLEQWVGDNAANIDYRLKKQAQMVESLVDALVEVKSSVGENTGRAGTG